MSKEMHPHRLVAAFWLGVLVIGITACASVADAIYLPNGPVFRRAPEPPAGYALLYVFRPAHNIDTFKSPDVYLNDQLVVRLPNHGYTWLHVPAGHYRVTTKDTEWGDPLSFELAPGRRCYLQLLSDAEKIKSVNLFFAPGFVAATPGETFIHKRHMWLLIPQENEGDAYKFALETHRFVDPVTRTLSPEK